MKPGKYLLIALFASSLSLTGCIKDDYYNVQPTSAQPVGYQYSFDDNFDRDQYNWSFSDKANAAKVTVGGGTLQYIYEPKNDGTNTVAIQTGANLNNDFLIQTKISSNNAMGLVFGVSDNDYGYSLMIDDQGYFALYSEGSANISAKALIDWQESTAIQQGWNEIELEQVDGYWVGYANGTKLFELKQKQLYGSKIGFITLANTRGFADYLTVQW